MESKTQISSQIDHYEDSKPVLFKRKGKQMEDSRIEKSSRIINSRTTRIVAVLLTAFKLGISHFQDCNQIWTIYLEYYHDTAILMYNNRIAETQSSGRLENMLKSNRFARMLKNSSQRLLKPLNLILSDRPTYCTKKINLLQ